MIDEKKEILADFLSGKDDPSEVVTIGIPEYCRLDGIECYGVYHGLNKDPVPPPARFAVSCGTQIFTPYEMGRLIEKAPLPLSSDEDAVRICLLYLFLAEGGYSAVQEKGSLYPEAGGEDRQKRYLELVPAEVRDKLSGPKTVKAGSSWTVSFFVHEYSVNRISVENRILKYSFSLSRRTFDEKGRETVWTENT